MDRYGTVDIGCLMGMCQGTTQSGSRCKNRISIPSASFCYQHGGRKSGYSAKGLSPLSSSRRSTSKRRSSTRGTSKTRRASHQRGGNGNGKSLYDRLGGIFAIAAVVNYFSDRILEDPLVGRDSPNPQLREWSRQNSSERLPGLKWMRTLWVAEITGGPYKFVATRPGHNRLALENAHRNLRIAPEEFDRVAEILSESMKKFKVPKAEHDQVVAAFAAHKSEVTEGFMTRLNETRRALAREKSL